MKQKTNSAVLIFVLVGFAGISWVANQIFDWKKSLSQAKVAVPTQFYAGMDKFLSNVSWMTLIQWQADDLQMKATGSGDKLYQKLNALTNLDPMFADAYLDGALSLAASNPDQAVSLLQKAIDSGAAANNWKIPFYAGQIRLMNSKDAEAALPYFERAMKTPDVPDYVESTFIHARCVSVNEEPVASMKIWYEYFSRLQGSDADRRRASAATRISEYAESATAALDMQIQATTDADKRAKLSADRLEVETIAKDVASAIPAAPTSLPAI